MRNTIERAVILCPDNTPLDAGHLSPGFGKAADPLRWPTTNSCPRSRGNTVDDTERMLIIETLEATGQNKTRAAEILGVSLKTLHNKLKEYSQAKELPAIRGLLTLPGRMALREKIGSDEAEPEVCGGSTVEGENEV